MSVKDKIKKYKETEEVTAEPESSEESETIERKEPAPAPAEEIQLLKEKLASAENDSKSKYDQLLRLAAEFDNYKKRSSREMEEFRKYANEALLKELLTVVDNLERAVDFVGGATDATSCVIEGVRMTLQEILKILEKFGVKPIDSLGKSFDPAFQQAILQEESVGQPENIVLKEMLKGYMIHDRLLRAAMVVVSKPGVPPSDSENMENQSDIES